MSHTPPITILIYNDDWAMLPRALPDLPAGCRVVFDRASFDTAHVVVFHIPTLRSQVLRKRPGQRWVAWSMESSVHYPVLDHVPTMVGFDWTMTYRRYADVWTPYLGASLLDELRTPVQPKSEVADAVYIASNARDRSGRTAYVRELMRNMAVDAYGKSLQNRMLKQDTGRATKLLTLARYRFTLAFENAVDPGYVTEKFFDPLVAGSVPVYLGAPDIADFAPGEHCYIDASRFAGPTALAAHLTRLANDAAAYQQLLDWKRQPLRNTFTDMVERACVHPLVRLALLARHWAKPALAPVSET